MNPESIAKDIARTELIGLKVEIVDAKNKAVIGLKGTIVDETKNMLKINNKRVIKDQVTLKIEKKGRVIQVDGRLLVGRPEERVKKSRRLK